MKMTMHIDEEVLDRVKKITGAKTKREAVEIALNDMARRHKMKELFKAGLGLTPDELKAEFANSTDTTPFDTPIYRAQAAAKDPAPYGKSPAP